MSEQFILFYPTGNQKIQDSVRKFIEEGGGEIDLSVLDHKLRKEIGHEVMRVSHDFLNSSHEDRAFKLLNEKTVTFK